VGIDVQVAEDLPEGCGTTGIVQWAGLVVEHMGDAENSTEVCIRLVGEPESRVLNADYRQQDKPTNVLSFPADVPLPDSAARYLGDMVVCEPVVRREAAEQNKRVEDHLAHMVVHGMLHLYGYDHIEPGEADVMEDIEREILGKVGIADPYREL
jgi:probable rRNA maturation factor